MSLNRIAGMLVTVLLTAVAACGEVEKGVPPNPAVTPPDPAVKPPNPWAEQNIPNPCEMARVYEAELEILRSRYSDNHPDVVRLSKLIEAAQAQCSGAPGDKMPSGEWRVQDGMRVCDGYIVRDADQDYCAAEVPEDWVPFTFDGQEYYIQPLKDPDHEQAVTD
jgi:hypothetical protein